MAFLTNEIALASASPRRAYPPAMLGIGFQTDVSGIEEYLDTARDVEERARELG